MSSIISEKQLATIEWSNKWFQFILDNPDEFWDWYELSRNPNLTWDIVLQNPDNQWDWVGLSRNPNLTWDIVQNTIDKPWDYKKISRNSNITWDIVQQNPDKDWDWGGLSRNSNITWDIVQQNPNRDWNFIILSDNPNITWDVVQKNPDKDWDWVGLSRNSSITWDIVQQNSNRRWDWLVLSSKPNVTCNIVKKNSDKKWNWCELSRNPSLTWDIVQQNPDKPWDWGELSRNPNITLDIVQQNIDKPWDWYCLSAVNPNLTWDIVRQNPDKPPCGWYAMSENPNLTWDIVQQNPDNVWSWDELSRNPNITWDIVQQNPDKPWDWEALSENSMTLARDKFISEKLNALKLKESSQQTQPPEVLSNSEINSPLEITMSNPLARRIANKSTKISTPNTVQGSSLIPQEPQSNLPIDNINLCFVGGVSTGKSTILNAIFCEELTQCKIKRTTMVPTVYVENENDAPNLDSPSDIFAKIAQKNQEIIEKTESGVPVADAEYAELQFNVGKLDINILPDSYVNVYDIPGLNDARTKTIYHNYLQRNFHRFNLVVFIVDIHSGLNTSDEADILNFIADHTRRQLDTNQKKIYTLVVVNKADDMQLVPGSEDNELEPTGELGEMFDQVRNSVCEAFKGRNIADHLVGIIPLCAIDSYLYRMTQKHGDKFKLTPQQILKIGINENGKRFSALKPETQEKKVREILNDKEFVNTMIKLSGFGRFEKLLHTFLSQNNTGKQIRIDNLLFEFRKLPQVGAFVAEHIHKPNEIADLLDSVFKTINAIRKIDKEQGDNLADCTSSDVGVALRNHFTNVMKPSISMTGISGIVAIYNNFRSRILTPYFGTDAVYPEYLCILVLNKICHNLTTDQISTICSRTGIELCEKLGILTRSTFEQLNSAILNNENRMSTFNHSYRGREEDDRLLMEYVETGEKLGVDMAIFMRFVLLTRFCHKTYYTEEQLFQKSMLYREHNEIPVYTYLQSVTAKLNPSPEWFILGNSFAEEPAHKFDVEYLKRHNNTAK